MFLELIRALPVAIMVRIVPGWFWTKLLLRASTDIAERITYSVALSTALVPTVALIPAQLLGSGVTLVMAVASPLVVLGTGLLAYRRFGPSKVTEGPLTMPTVAPTVTALLPVIVAFALVLGAVLKNWRLFWLAGSCWRWPWEACVHSGGAQKFMLPIVLLLLGAGIVHRLASSRELEAQAAPPNQGPQDGRIRRRSAWRGGLRCPRCFCWCSCGTT